MDISQPIDAYFARIDACIQYASDGKTPYTAKKIITTVLHAVQKTQKNNTSSKVYGRARLRPYDYD
eukprot:10153663-Ditylum_brightwellii.AAC.1